jgi:hypothetical protein
MSHPRTYDDDEIREIFAAAASHDLVDPRQATAAQGLTLAELQEIGRAAGFDVAEVTRAAAALDARLAQAPERTSLGMPIEVVRIVPLPRSPTELEWEQLVGELRATFGARGRMISHGGLREWANGNLHACVEPSENGYRLRLGTLKGEARALNALGAGGVVAGAIALAAVLIPGAPLADALAPVVIAASGIAAFGANFLGLARWADTRRKQMDYIAARVSAIVEGEPRR